MDSVANAQRQHGKILETTLDNSDNQEVKSIIQSTKVPPMIYRSKYQSTVNYFKTTPPQPLFCFSTVLVHPIKYQSTKVPSKYQIFILREFFSPPLLSFHFYFSPSLSFAIDLLYLLLHLFFYFLILFIKKGGVKKKGIQYMNKQNKNILVDIIT